MTADRDDRRQPDRGRELVSDDWRGMVAEGRFTDARAVVRVTADAGAERAHVEILAEIQELAREKAWQRAIRRIEHLSGSSLPIDPDALERELAILGSASAALDRREPDDALAALDDLDDPYLVAEAATQRGTAYVLMDRGGDARSEFERALDVDPRHFRAITNLGNLELEAGEVDGAIAAYEQALRINDDFANAHHNLGVALRRKGKVGRSVRSLRRAQRAMQKAESERARESARSVGGARYLRWVLIGLAALALYLFLRAQGIV